MAIWFITPTLSQLNQLSQDTLGERIGIEFTAIGDDFLRARMPVDARTVQPARLLHGGASVALAETLGSVGATLCIDPVKQSIVGLEINANHVRAAREGSGDVIGTARPLHLGKSTQVWEVRIHDAQERLVCISRLTLAVLDRAQP
ncbi:MAG: hotdog fold thioesterase [Anaerolineae bacterium]|nr:hotdog fold thioesterase [Anaerolineae bacterium]